MKPSHPFPHPAIAELFQTLFPDFVLAFAFFTALSYAVLSRRFHHQRSAITMSGTIGLALSVGLVWWEQRNSLSIRDLGPIAVGFAIILVAFVMYQAIRQMGGSWAGAGIALGAALLISKLLGLDWALDQQLLHAAISVTLIVGILAFLLHQMWHAPSLSPRHVRVPKVRYDMRGLQQNRKLSKQLDRRFVELERRSQNAFTKPADVEELVQQLQRMLPAQGHLTERLAQLREKAYRLREGHVARIEELRSIAGRMPAEAKRQLAKQLREQYSQLGLAPFIPIPSLNRCPDSLTMPSVVPRSTFSCPLIHPLMLLIHLRPFPLILLHFCHRRPPRREGGPLG
ncbi:MAG: hypothetical protein ISS72_03535 [Candidatus Brocadiae bacterium]|nr:hypothetical protein [Candidatus Brocadiia bacterium]